MTATDTQIARLRRMIHEPTQETYSDADLRSVIESHPIRDSQGEQPFLEDGITPNPEWIPTYDMAHSAATIWEEKAAALAEKVNFSADGASVSLSQLYLHAQNQARYWYSRRQAKSQKVIAYPSRTHIGRRLDPEDQEY